MIKKFAIFVLAALCIVTVADAQQKKFYNLSADEIRVDTILSEFVETLPLEGQYNDSTYSAEILYPGFVEMTTDEIQLLQKLHSEVMPLPTLPEVKQNIVISRGKASIIFSFNPFVFRDGKYQKLTDFMLSVTSSPALTMMKADGDADTEPRYTEQSILSNGKWAKITVSNTGITQLTEETIKSAGFKDLTKVRIFGYGGAMQQEKLTAENVKLYNSLPEVPSCFVNGKRFFYGIGPVNWTSAHGEERIRNPYSSYGAYFITEDGKEPLTITKDEFLSLASMQPARYYSLYEKDDFAWFQAGQKLYDSEVIGSEKEYSVKTPEGVKNGTLTIAFTTNDVSTFEISLNDSVLGSAQIKRTTYMRAVEKTLKYNVTNLAGDNKVKVKVKQHKAGSSERLDFIQIHTVSPFPVYDLEKAEYPSAKFMYRITNQNLHADKDINMVIIIPTSQKLRDEAERLAQIHRDIDSMKVKVVPADEIYNEFSSGTPSATAYRLYMKMLYDKANGDENKMPKYLLLFGDCVWDNRMLTPECSKLNVDDYLLCYESVNSLSEVESYVDDDYFAILDDGEGGDEHNNHLRDIAVGRITAHTASEAQIVVSKIKNYIENKNAGAWQDEVLFLGDDGNGNMHMRDVDEAAEAVKYQEPELRVKKIMWDAYPIEMTSTGFRYPEVTDLIHRSVKEGALLIDYSGHGSPSSVSHEMVLVLNDFKNFVNKVLPMWVTATCDIMPFDGLMPNIGEEALFNSRGGAIAFYGTTRTVLAYYNKFINKAYVTNVLKVVDGKPISIGEASRLAKNYLITSGKDKTNNKLQYVLLGDPAMRLNRPTEKLAIDSINGKPLDGYEKIVLKAGDKVNISGRVLKNNATDSLFNGLAEILVRDKEVKVRCRNNDGLSDTNFEFRDRSQVIFQGADSVRNGHFKFHFVVPMDINYDNGSGLVNVFACNGERGRYAHGVSNDFIVGGTGNTDNDGIGPSVYCYLNSPSFKNGGDVNPEPMFFAEISDEDGINTTGSGVGHDLQLIIDGKKNLNYVLNDNFEYEFGSYTDGLASFKIPMLSEGKHRLQFRVWDIFNNSTTTELDFNVVNGIAPHCLGVKVSPNPAREHAQFIIQHDNPGGNLFVKIEIFDMSGRKLWQYEENGIAEGHTYTVDWDVTVGGGRRLRTGVYLYRVTIGAGGGATTSKTQKLIVISNN